MSFETVQKRLVKSYDNINRVLFFQQIFILQCGKESARDSPREPDGQQV